LIDKNLQPVDDCIKIYRAKHGAYQGSIAMGVMRLLAGLFDMGVIVELGEACFPSFFLASDFVVSAATESLLVASITMSAGF
jgi:hypothetical protein